ncbi:MAG: carboxylating nicotinate-nucleotide diphosphorylase [Oscillospiraceae bacterium]|jgi:nicotinate-nucleotide pyrophosphorylase (carboxylating)|nr:carboxylating nicotinate-nucleotide diphosphorylase [Oscillospiraceae bacterium]
MNLKLFDDFLLSALREDMPFGDISSEAVFDAANISTARLVAKADGVLCGLSLFRRVFELLGVPRDTWEIFFADGEKLHKSDVICTFSGPTLALLAGERTGLNLLQHLSGIAAQTAVAVAAVEGTDAIVTETRKTLPGLRALQKYAVRMGGGHNHRFSLSDAVMLKDNHIDAVGGIASAVAKVRAAIGHTVKVEVETRNIDEVRQALEAGTDIIMLDNMAPDDMRKAVVLVNHRAVLEASGGITLANIREYAETGVDVISIGALTHSVMALDISMQIAGQSQKNCLQSQGCSGKITLRGKC